MRDNSKKTYTFTRRAFALCMLKFSLFIILFIRYYYLQLLDSLKYQTLSDKNRIKLLITAPLRGPIIDRNGIAIVSNKKNYKATIESHDAELIFAYQQKLQLLLGRDLELNLKKVKAKLNTLSKQSTFTLLANLEWEDVAKIELNIADFPGVFVEEGQVRIYDFADKTAHLTGYIGTPTQKDIENSSIPNITDFYIGKNGAEKAFNNRLQGVPGVKKSEVDAVGQQIREISAKPSIQGESLQLGCDIKLQEFIVELLSKQHGSIVVLDVVTGQVLAMHSSPAYDPNKFVGGISYKDWQEVSNAEGTPLINKCISFPYPPGSPFKVVTALAALENDIPANFKVVCNGKHRVGNRVFHCWNRRGHGNVDMRLAIAQSCNIYFYTLAERLGINKIVDIAKKLGLGSKTGIQLPYESKGNIPEPKWKLLRFKQNWVRGDTINACIGQGFVLATPLQLAVLSARIASGKMIIPTLTKSTPTFKDCSLNPANLQIIREGMSMIFNDPRGNSYQHRMPDFMLCGKTGTAQVISQRKTTNKKLQDHGLFIGFAPYQQPRYALSVMVEHGSWGSQSALPLATKIFEYCYKQGIEGIKL